MHDIGPKLAKLEDHLLPTHYEPSRHRTQTAALDYGIKEAKRLKEWPLLEQAVDAKIEEQQRFAAWWVGSVTARHGGPKSRVRGTCSLADAEQMTGMSNQRVSDLRTALKAPEAYR